MIRYSRAGIPYGQYEKAEKKYIEKPNSVGWTNILLVGLLALVILLYLLT